MRFDGCFDISHHNGSIKWSKVAEAGYKLVFIKATQGTKFVDPMLDRYWEGADDAGLMIVPYHFINTEPANVQAAHFIENAELGNGAPCMLDWERLNGQMPAIGIVEDLLVAIRTATRRNPVVYHGLFELSSKRINACPWFVPRWGPEPQMKWLFWQDTDHKTIPGVPRPADHDWFNGSLTELEEWYNTGALPKAIK